MMTIYPTTSGLKRKRLLTSTMIAGLATVALPAAVAFTALAPSVASAQDYTSGTLSGTVADSAGAPVPGATVVVTSNAQGQARTLTTDATGQFRVPLIPQGAYTVEISKTGYNSTSDNSLAVRAGGESSYTFTLAEAGAVSEVVITATANPQLDFSQTTTGVTVDLETLQKQMPIARNITAVTLLAPGATEGSSTNFRGQVSISGASVAENAFYLNGLNITNFNNYIGGATVPFDFYKSVEVKTGGYSAEFGRATGGIVNAVTKAGTNDFMFAVHVNYEPGEWGAEQKDTYQTRGSMREYERKEVIFEAGGPIIKDRLFAYGLVNLRDFDLTNGGSITGGTYNVDHTVDPFYGLKIDAYITSRQHLELTAFDSTNKVKRETWAFNPVGDVIGAKRPGSVFTTGGVSYVAKYTGSFTDWLTVSAAYGVSKDSDETVSELVTVPLVQSSVLAGPGAGTIATRQVGIQSQSGADFPTQMEREFYRGDVDLYVSLLGDHHIRAGFDTEKLSLARQTRRYGNANYIYRQGSATDPRGITDPSRIYLEARTFVGGGDYEAENKAIYIQDSWEVLENLTLNLGLRRDQFQVSSVSLNGVAGTPFVDFDNEIGARLGLTWDPGNDGTNKVYANYGRYYLPVASNTSFRQASAILDQSAFFLMPAGFQVYVPGTTQVNSAFVNTSTGLPNAGLAGTQISYASGVPCLPGGIGATGVVGCTIRNNGTVQNFESNTSRNIKSTADDEYLIGYEHRFDSLWKAGANLTFRQSVRAADDVGIDFAIVEWCQRNNIAGCENTWTGFHQYTIINPGFDQTITLTDILPGETSRRTINFTKEQLRYPKIDRQYIALQLTAERAFDGKWGMQASYTVSESKGNYEGYVKTDYGGGQKDAGITADFDTPGLTEGAYGLLPNHRGHQFKLFGNYQLFDSFSVGANVLVQSGRKYGCLGLSPTDEVLNDNYGALSRYCGGKLTPRGASFSDPWSSRLDLAFRYTVPAFAYLPENGLVLRADVFNVFNSRKTVESWEYGETNSGAIDSNYGKALSYQTPRYVRIGFDLQF